MLQQCGPMQYILAAIDIALSTKDEQITLFYKEKYIHFASHCGGNDCLLFFVLYCIESE